MSFKTIRRAVVGLVGVAALVLMTGCAHQVSMTPDTKQLAAAPAKINKSIAYVISAADLTKEVQTPGGGGDKIKYQPYRDLDGALYQAFSAVFADVSKVTNASEAKGVTFVITPSITTNSSSDSMFTWPPTQFSVDLVCSVADIKGQAVTEVRASGKGAATFDQFKSDLSLAARLASMDAVNNLVKALTDSAELRR
ncbi:MAG: hypothetical protein Q7U28_16860 [Aquabacterium sp.]|nr:hypothetical protein [Aquabacterium sp.]